MGIKNTPPHNKNLEADILKEANLNADVRVENDHDDESVNVPSNSDLEESKKELEEMLKEHESIKNEIELEKIYGKSFVRATKDGMETIFTRITWNNLQANKDGWREIISVPPEVIKLQNKE